MSDATSMIIDRAYNSDDIGKKLDELEFTKVIPESELDNIPSHDEWAIECLHYITKTHECDTFHIYDDVTYGGVIVSDSKSDIVLCMLFPNFVDQSWSINSASFVDSNGDTFTIDRSGVFKQVLDFEDD